MAKPVLTIANVTHSWVDDERYAVSFSVIGLNCDPEKDVSAKLLKGDGEEKNGNGEGEEVLPGMLMSNEMQPGDKFRIYARCGTALAIQVITVSERPS